MPGCLADSTSIRFTVINIFKILFCFLELANSLVCTANFAVRRLDFQAEFLRFMVIELDYHSKTIFFFAEKLSAKCGEKNNTADVRRLRWRVSCLEN